MKENFNNLPECIERQFISFIVKSVRGLKLDYLRRQRKFESEISMNQPESYFHEMSSTHNFEIGILGNEDILNALKALTDRQKIVIQLVIFQDLTEKAAANILGVSQQGVHKTKKRALKMLKEVLKEDLG